jgi:hypothetical protein
LEKEIILVGTYHFEQDEELIANKEKEVIELVDYLAHYKPTKVAVEWEASKDKDLNIEYKKSDRDYLIDEIHQIGFRLAKKLNHEKVYAVNWSGKITKEDMEELNASIQDSYPELLNKMKVISENAPVISINTPLVNSFRKLNDNEGIKELERIYLSFVTVTDSKENMIGFDFLNKWLERELMIFKNIVETTKSNDRTLLIIGSDHLWMLRKLFEGNGWKVINPFA